MDFSIRSLKKSQENSRRKYKSRDEPADQMSNVIRMVRDIYQRRGSNPISVGDLLTHMNKKELARISKEELL